jgi:hypothetical protein
MCLAEAGCDGENCMKCGEIYITESQFSPPERIFLRGKILKKGKLRENFNPYSISMKM